MRIIIPYNPVFSITITVNHRPALQGIVSVKVPKDCLTALILGCGSQCPVKCLDGNDSGLIVNTPHLFTNVCGLGGSSLLCHHWQCQ